MSNRSVRVAAMDNPNHMFIPRHELKLLRELLREIPDLALDLGIAVTKQARLGEVGRSRKPRRPSEQPLPYHVAAADAAEELHNALVGWVRLTCEQRDIDYTGPTSTPALAKWLHRNIVALAMTEGSETALPEIRDAMQAAEWIVCPPMRPHAVDQARIDRARKLMLNVSGIAALAKELGEEYRHLTKRRVHVLKEAGRILPVPGPWRIDWPVLYFVGDVLDAHLSLPIRERHAEAC
ncbi:hypothetical protein [Nocardia australiensis]|uniref:hypothetical protein n=1 Tax=Nocardia australiensis TaxID=2887191 RepID=UPI001D1444B4|nr:hypothetical protein [Nocardia australiensis]